MLLNLVNTLLNGIKSKFKNIGRVDMDRNNSIKRLIAILNIFIEYKNHNINQKYNIKKMINNLLWHNNAYKNWMILLYFSGILKSQTIIQIQILQVHSISLKLLYFQTLIELNLLYDSFVYYYQIVLL